MEKDKLICPVERINRKPSLDIKISKPDDESIEVSVKTKDMLTPILDEYYNKFKKFLEGKKNG